MGSDDGWDNQCVEPNPLHEQVGGKHYKGWVIQPVEFLQRNSIHLDWCSSNIIKYACRWREKGLREDVEKIKHYADLLIKLEGL